jgi:hypothetical protein
LASRNGYLRTFCDIHLLRIYMSKALTSERFKCYSEWRHTANEQPTEVRITYRFHPRFGETVFIRRCLERGGIEYFVVHQPDGSFACLPAWMMQPSASRFEICDKPNFSLDILRSLRAQVDDLLGFLLSESKTERTDNDAPKQKSPAKPVRRGEAAHRAAAGSEGRARHCRRSSAPRDRSGSGQRKARGERS